MCRFSKMPRRCSRCVAEIRRIAAEGTGTDTEPAAGGAAEGAELGIADPRRDVGKLQRALYQIAVGQAAPGVVKHAQEGAGIITSLTETDGLVELSEDTTTVTPGSTVGFLSYAALAA